MGNDIFSVRPSKEQRDKLEEFKRLTGLKGQYGEENRALFLAVDIALNVLLSNFGHNYKIQITPLNSSKRIKKIFRTKRKQ